MNRQPVAIFEGRECVVIGHFRIAGKPGRYGHNRMQIKFLDNGETKSVPAGLWGRKAKDAPISTTAVMAKGHGQVRDNVR